jgi:hypothetical protein
MCLDLYVAQPQVLTGLYPKNVVILGHLMTGSEKIQWCQSLVGYTDICGVSIKIKQDEVLDERKRITEFCEIHNSEILNDMFGWAKGMRSYW